MLVIILDVIVILITTAIINNKKELIFIGIETKSRSDSTESKKTNIKEVQNKINLFENNMKSISNQLLEINNSNNNNNHKKSKRSNNKAIIKFKNSEGEFEFKLSNCFLIWCTQHVPPFFVK